MNVTFIVNFGDYSYLKASTRSSLAALHAGYTLESNVTVMDIVIAKPMYMGFTMGLNVKANGALLGPPIRLGVKLPNM